MELMFPSSIGPQVFSDATEVVGDVKPYYTNTEVVGSTLLVL